MTADLHSTTCGRELGSIAVTNNNGIAPFTYSIDGTNFQTSNSFTGLAAGIYTVISRDRYNATQSANFIVTTDCPTVTATATAENCAQQDAVITATGAEGLPPYSYSLDAVNFQTSNIFDDRGQGLYTVTMKDANGFTSTCPVKVISDCMLLTVTSTASKCGAVNGALTVRVTDGAEPYSYSLDGVNWQFSNIFPSLLPGTYTISVKDLTGVKVSTTASVGDMPGPQMSVLTQAASCDDDGTLNIQAGGGTAPLSYSLDGINFQTTPQFTGLPFGNKTPMVKDANGCTVSRSVVVSVDDDLYLNGATASPICQGTSTTLAISSNASSFTWTPADGLNDPTAKLPVASPDASTTYQVTAKTGSCELTTTVSVLVNPAPVADARAGQTICYGESADLQGSGGTTYNWSPATSLDDPQSATPTVQKPDQDMTYRLTVTDDNGCSSLNDARVAITVTAPAAVFASRDTAILNGQSLQLQAIDINQVGFIQYSWSPSMGLDNTAISNPVATISGDIQYLVTATTIAGCTGSDTVNIKSFSVSNIFVPNAFTPDGNGRNDYLKPVLIGIKQMQYFKVFNRWGQQVFSASVAIPGWDGLINGQKQDTGTYVWSAGGIDYQDRAIQRQGTVVLIR